MSTTLTVLEGQRLAPLKWFEYSQNNSGGVFDHEPEAGIGYTVWVQAKDAQEADYRAERIGLYFDGEGDCSCCGDRWSSAWGEGQTEEPSIYVGKYGADEDGLRWGLPTYAHRYDGTFYVVTARKEL